MGYVQPRRCVLAGASTAVDVDDGRAQNAPVHTRPPSKAASGGAGAEEAALSCQAGLIPLAFCLHLVSPPVLALRSGSHPS